MLQTKPELKEARHLKPAVPVPWRAPGVAHAHQGRVAVKPVGAKSGPGTRVCGVILEKPPALGSLGTPMQKGHDCN